MKICKIIFFSICILCMTSSCAKTNVPGSSFIEMCVDNSDINFSDIQEYLLQKKGDTYVIYMTTNKGVFNFKFSQEGVLLQQQKLSLETLEEDNNETEVESSDSMTELAEEEYVQRAKDYTGFQDDQIVDYSLNVLDGQYIVYFNIQEGEEIHEYGVVFDALGNPISLQ